nr:MAG TPA: hypothetical protein [Caudoviricetes sp.]
MVIYHLGRYGLHDRQKLVRHEGPLLGKSPLVDCQFLV